MQDAFTARLVVASTALAGLIGLVLVTLASGPALAAPTCDGKPADIVRGPGDNDITGTDEADVIIAGGGDDSIHAGGGRDRVCAGDGVDETYGEGGADPYLHGQGGRDWVDGGEGNDKVYGGPNADGGETTWRGGQSFGAGLEGNAGDDVARGGTGADEISGGGGEDRAFGQDGSDSLHMIDGEADLADGGRGSDVCDIDLLLDERRSCSPVA